jgi:hypothetical protein
MKIPNQSPPPNARLNAAFAVGAIILILILVVSMARGLSQGMVVQKKQAVADRGIHNGSAIAR